MEAYLILEDGCGYTGESLGMTGEAAGEVVFNTGMTGYQEILTDPSYYGQIVALTYPLVGNYGIDSNSCQSSKPQVRGFVVSEACSFPSHWRSEGGLQSYLSLQGVVAISGVDTRALTRHIRDRGTMNGVITSKVDKKGVPPVERARRLMNRINLKDAVMRVTTEREYKIPGDGPRIVLLDYGAKNRILANLEAAGCDMVVVPAWYKARDIMDLKPDGIVLSNGPGDPRDLDDQVGTISELIGKVPMLGICLGHQVLALASGAQIYKMKFGHRGSNHPVKDLHTGRAWITSQNHGYAVDEQSLRGTGVDPIQVNLTDGSIEALEDTGKGLRAPTLSVQYHPEAGPGPHDSARLFNKFMETVWLYSGPQTKNKAYAS